MDPTLKDVQCLIHANGLIQFVQQIVQSFAEKMKCTALVGLTTTESVHFQMFVYQLLMIVQHSVQLIVAVTKCFAPVDLMQKVVQNKIPVNGLILGPKVASFALQTVTKMNSGVMEVMILMETKWLTSVYQMKWILLVLHSAQPIVIPITR